MKKIDWKFANTLGIFFVLLFIVCLIWFAIHPAQRELHMGLFEVSFFGFSGMNAVSIIFAVIQAYIWAYIFVGLWVLANRIGKTT